MPYWPESREQSTVMHFGEECACRVESEGPLMRFLMDNEYRVWGLSKPCGKE